MLGWVVTICNTCLLWGDKEEQCYGQCNHCLNWGHDPTNCSKSIEKTKAKIVKARAKNKAKKAKAKISKPDSPKATFDLTLPEGYENSSTDSQSKEAQQRYPTYQKCYLIAAPLMFPSSMGPNRPPHTAREYPR